MSLLSVQPFLDSTISANSVSLGAIVIGRNEGERLRRCLASLHELAVLAVYVDSGSTDGSVALAHSLGVEVVELNMQTAFTAARARNAGFARLRQLAPAVAFVQFIDGDCEIVDGWLAVAMTFLLQHPEVACVCGQLRERFPEKSVYNRLCDFEWDSEAGETDACGGIAMMRTSVLLAVGGFRDDMVAGEEPELCRRIRDSGEKIWRLDHPMALHDAAMLRFSQWWKRSKRTGFSYAHRVSIGRDIETGLMRSLVRAWVWAGALPLMVTISWILWGDAALLLLLAYPLQVLRMSARGERPLRDRLARALFVVLGKFPEMLGQLQFWGESHTSQGCALVRLQGLS